MTYEEAKAILNIYAGITMMSAMKEPDNESMANMCQKTIEAVRIACDAIDMVSDRLEMEHKDDGKSE
jgi:hypothetical protein